MSISGLIERVTYHNQETGFCVVRVQVKGRRDLVTVIGNAATITAGEWLTAEGEWVQDRDHGMQLKAEFIKTSEPTSEEGIEKYLGSGLIKGIGPTYAKKLVEKFGDGVFNIIDQFSVRLEEVRGIGSERRRLIKSAWAEQKVVREIMVFLHSNGVGTSRAVRIYKTYGEEAIERVRANPYLLAQDIQGIGFKTADTIAGKLGIPPDSLIRARAGLLHTLAEASGNGHCALPNEMLRQNACALLEMDSAILDRALAEMLSDGSLIADSTTPNQLVYLPAMRAAEIGIATNLARFAEKPPTYPVIDIEKAIAWLQEKNGRELAPSQSAALAKALTSRVLVITGGPGVGKTTLMHSILSVLHAKKVNCLLCAPTGRAAKRLSESTGMEAKTIHRLLEFQGGGFSRNASRPLDCDLLVTDESSMIDASLMFRLLQALPEKAHLLLVGDVDQLPSVGAGAVLGDIIQSGAVPVVRLTEIFRQSATSRIIVNAHRINNGEMPESVPDSDFFFIEREEPEAIQETLLEIVSTRIPRKLGVSALRDIQVLCPMNRGSLGAVQMNKLLQERLNPKQPNQPFAEKFGWQFRPRDKVIQTRNNYDKEVFNGDIGEITGIDEIELEVRISFDGREVVYDFNELDEISLAYAITIHKSQGSEFPVVVMPLAMQQYLLLQRNLLYTGVTRGKRLVVLVGQKKALQTAIRNAESNRRFTALAERLRAAVRS
jgi:exodeoxyribonuclease V alpha subunit